MDAETVLSAVTNVPPSLLRDMCLIGTPEDVIDQVAEWRATGLRYVVAINASVIQQSLRKAVESTTPFLKILRGLRKL